VYDIVDLVANVRQGVSSLTQPPLFASSTSHCHQLPKNDCFHAKVQEVEEVAMKATQDAQWENERASYLEHTLKMVQD